MKYALTKKDRMAALRIVAVYAFFSFLWIYLSDSLMGLLFQDPTAIVKFSQIKGSLFITVMGALLYHLVARYIQKSRSAEEALKRSEEKLRLFVENSPAAIAMLDCNMNYLDASRRWYEAYNLAGRGIIGRSHYEVFPDLPERWKEIHQRCLTGDVERNEADRWLRADGTTAWIRWEVRPWYQNEDEIGGIIIFSEDISDLMEAKEEIRRLNQDLAARAAELEEANVDLEAFNYTVAHDLRKPLTIINGYCHVIRDLCGQRLDEECAGYLQEAYEGTWRMSRLIDTLLNFSRVNRLEPRRERVDLTVMALTVAAELKHAEPSRRATFRVADGISVVGDPGLLRVVMENLIGNAWKYTAIREEAVIEVGETETEGRRACFVRDNGPGFAMEYADQLFIPFRRLPGAEEHVGFGIGLATVERIIRRHGGRIWAEGEPGKGATFRFMLPEEPTGEP